MKAKLNPEYHNAPYEGVAMDKDGKRCSEMVSAMVFGRLRPPRWKLENGVLVEVFPFVFVNDDGGAKP